LVIFDDDRGQLGPMVELRPAFDLRTGAHRTLERIERRLSRFPAAWWVPQRLVALWSTSTEHPVNELPDGDTVLVVNGRWLGLGELPELGLNEAAVAPDGSVISACLSRVDAPGVLNGGDLPDAIATTTLDLPMLMYPWDLITSLSSCLLDDLEASSTPLGCPDQVSVVGTAAVRIHPEAVVFPGVIVDASAGPVVVARDAIIRPGVVLCGPCHIARGSTVTDRAVIRCGTVVGPGCKVGGEVGASVFQGRSNKAHDGYLGDTWVGEWVNLGAGTTTSNLLNTYGEITMRPCADGPRMRTHRTFLGSVVGDHVKTAIGTRLMTGTVLGTGCMIASSTPPPASMAPLRWLTDAGERPYRIGKFFEALEAVFARRGQHVSDALRNRLQSLSET
jgi:UDP-N-acetylglucosamine diphosphorylase/glucosamine-1-phosphate N-acetyltransferase